MSNLSPRVEAIKMSLDDQFPVGQKHWEFSVVEKAQELMKAFKLMPEEYMQIVDITQQKLQELLGLDNSYGNILSMLGELSWQEDSEGNGKLVMFRSNSKEKKVDLIWGTSRLVKPEEMKAMNDFLERSRRQYIVKARRSEESAANVILNA